MTTRPKAGTGHEKRTSEYADAFNKRATPLIEASDILMIPPEPDEVMKHADVNLSKERMDSGTFKTRKA